MVVQGYNLPFGENQKSKRFSDLLTVENMVIQDLA